MHESLQVLVHWPGRYHVTANDINALNLKVTKRKCNSVILTFAVSYFNDYTCTCI